MGQIHWASCTGGIHWYPRVSPKIWGSKCSWLFKHYASPTVIGSWGNPSGWFSVSLPVWQDPRLRYIHPKGVLEVAAPPCLCSRKLPARKNKAKQQNHCCRAGNSDRSGFSSVLHVKNQVDTSNVAKEKKHRWEKTHLCSFATCEAQQLLLSKTDVGAITFDICVYAILGTEVIGTRGMVGPLIRRPGLNNNDGCVCHWWYGCFRISILAKKDLLDRTKIQTCHNVKGWQLVEFIHFDTFWVFWCPMSTFSWHPITKGD